MSKKNVELMANYVRGIVRSAGWSNDAVGLHSRASRPTVRTFSTSVMWIMTPEGVENVWRSMHSLSVQDVLDVLRLRWTSSGLADARDVVEQLVRTKSVRRVGSDSWKVLRHEQPPDDRKPYQPAKPPDARKTSPGTCPMCGEYVGYKNRHSRGESAHTGEECRTNRVRQVMEGLPSAPGGARGVRGVPRSEERRMPVHHSLQLDALAEAKCAEGLRKEVKALAAHVTAESYTMAMKTINSLKKADQKGWMRSDVLLTFVVLNQSCLVFEADPVTVSERIAGLQPSKKKDLPNKVLVKMVAGRLARLKLDLDDEGIKMPELGTKAELAFLLDTLDYRIRSVSEARAFLEKPELKDEHVADGWKTLVVKEVMSS